jgi:TM2 domain-containing protein
MMPGRAQGSVIHFDSSGAMFERPLVFSISVRSLVTNVLSPHGAMLRAALKPIIESNGIPTGQGRRSQTAVVLLAFMGGMFGLHHFYLGNHRKGIWSCIFCWTLVPFVLGLVDSVRFALLDDAQFRLVSRIA